MTDHIRADYNTPNSISQTFHNEAQRVRRVYDSLATTCTANLKAGGWVADSADAYYREMEEDILPSVQRLAEALAEAAEVTLQIKAIMQKAEVEAAAYLRDERADEYVQVAAIVPPMLPDIPVRAKVMGTVEQNDLSETPPVAHTAPEVTFYRFGQFGPYFEISGTEDPISLDSRDVAAVFSGDRTSAVILNSFDANRSGDAATNLNAMVEQLIAERDQAVNAITTAAAWRAVFNVLPVAARNVFGFEDSSDVSRFVTGAVGEEYITGGGGGNLGGRAAKGAAAGFIIQGVWELGSYALDELGERVEISNPEHATAIETGQAELYDEVVNTIRTEYSDDIQAIEGVNQMIAGLEEFQPIPGPTGENGDTVAFVYTYQGQTYLYVGVGDFGAGAAQEVYNAPISEGTALMVEEALHDTGTETGENG